MPGKVKNLSFDFARKMNNTPNRWKFPTMNDKLLEVLETLNYPTIIVDSDSTPLWANRKFLKLLISKKV